MDLFDMLEQLPPEPLRRFYLCVSEELSAENLPWPEPGYFALKKFQSALEEELIRRDSK